MKDFTLDAFATAAAWAALPPFIIWLFFVFIIDSMRVPQ